ncbi:MAG: hypothetical protein A3E98_02555 [Candidatus Doudnabacteria bacterium RIFCSPHIGHO2_12_FULL_48_11]|uniref:VCBS repeat-containing protein n=1 Tax=Candidatus Doudnabacteria bacterium RIFCSPHIGHO2_01_FULL_46_24 TaxID=1817825 RepID=A0A1F5NUB7_9BACT|nr:MAG: hypothetical protein A2720_01105 [Candidatus Doudnabacteria bacterium RIFCSPHIGHO2_01_FULL_46_24]OGE96103.1 MAG: hypothetical protein A3E98_02555 [Candidatus Doudnabacteria bacterium RIFCSPHIGHO2_12_FULL_48_11]
MSPKEDFLRAIPARVEATMRRLLVAVALVAFLLGIVTGAKAGGVERTILSLDLNSDGREDLLVYDPTTGAFTRVFQYPGWPYAAPTEYWLPGMNVVMGFLDEDASPDVIFYDPATGLVWQALNYAGTLYVTTVTSWPRGMLAYPFDHNGDGATDFFLYNRVTGEWSLQLNTWNGYFTEVNGRWSEGWEIRVGNFSAFDHNQDLLLYNRETGVWYKALSDGFGGFYYSQPGRWSPGWNVSIGRFNIDAADDVFLYNPVTGVWFRVFSDGWTGFYWYERGGWSAGWSVLIARLEKRGLDDLILYHAGTGAGFACVTQAYAGFRYHRLTLYNSAVPMVQDFSGDRLSDLLLWIDLTNPVGFSRYKSVLRGGNFDHLEWW